MRGSCRVRSVVSMNGRGARRSVDGTAQGGMSRRRTEARQHTTPKLKNQNQGYTRGGERRKTGERGDGHDVPVARNHDEPRNKHHCGPHALRVSDSALEASESSTYDTAQRALLVRACVMRMYQQKHYAPAALRPSVRVQDVPEMQAFHRPPNTCGRSAMMSWLRVHAKTHREYPSATTLGT